MFAETSKRHPVWHHAPVSMSDGVLDRAFTALVTRVSGWTVTAIGVVLYVGGGLVRHWRSTGQRSDLSRRTFLALRLPES